MVRVYTCIYKIKITNNLSIFNRNSRLYKMRVPKINNYNSGDILSLYALQNALRSLYRGKGKENRKENKEIKEKRNGAFYAICKLFV